MTVTRLAALLLGASMVFLGWVACAWWELGHRPDVPVAFREAACDVQRVNPCRLIDCNRPDTRRIA